MKKTAAGVASFEFHELCSTATGDETLNPQPKTQNLKKPKKKQSTGLRYVMLFGGDNLCIIALFWLLGYASLGTAEYSLAKWVNDSMKPGSGGVKLDGTAAT